MREDLCAVLEERARPAVRRSSIFPSTTMETYDFGYPKTIDRDLVTKAASLTFVEDKANVVFLVLSASGKTHLANAIGHLACLRGLRVRFVLAADLDQIWSPPRTKYPASPTRRWSAPALLLIDELGYLSFDARGADLLYQVFNRR